MLRYFSTDRIRPLFVLSLAIGFVAALFIKGCTPNGDRLTSIRVGINRWPGYDVALYAQEAGLFEERGLDVEFVNFDVAQDTTRSLISGSLDIAFVSLWELMQADTAEDPPVYVMVTNISHGSDGIVATPEIKSVAELKGKKVAAKLGTVSHLILLEALKLHNLQPEDTSIKDISNAVAVDSIQQGNVDAAVLWEPDLSQVAGVIDGNIIFTTKDVDSLVIDGLATRQSYLESHENEVTQFILAWFDLMQAVEERPNTVFSVVGEQLGQTLQSFAGDYSGLKKGDIAMNRRMFAPNGRLEIATQEIAELLREDPRHNREIHEDIPIDADRVTAAIDIWEQEQTNNQ